MKFKNIRTSEEGVEFDVEASNQEVSWLVNYAVEDLMKVGILSINENLTEQDVELREVTH